MPSAAGYAYEPYSSNEGPFTAVLILGVGTAMQRTDYSKLSQELVKEQTALVVVVVDFVANWPIKKDAQCFIHAVNGILSDFQTSNTIDPKTTRLLVGGHSGGGFAAAASLHDTQKYNISPQGYLGLDPVPPGMGPFPGRFAATIPIPSLVVGLEEKTCLVDPKKSARAAYSKSSKDHRTLLSIRNSNREYQHCVFTDDGCGIVCGENSIDKQLIYQGIAKAFAVFLDHLESNATQHAYETAIEDAPMMNVTALDGQDVDNKAGLPWWKF